MVVILLKSSFSTPNRPSTTWCVEADLVCSGPVMLSMGSNRRKSRPVFSLSPLSSRFAPTHTLNGGDFAQIVTFIPFGAQILNRPRTTRCVQAHGVCSGAVMLKKGSTGCKSRPVCSLFPVLSWFPLSHTLNPGDLAQIVPFIPF